MPYTQSKKTSDTEKKLQALKLQFYGKESISEKLRRSSRGTQSEGKTQKTRESEPQTFRNSDRSGTPSFPSNSESKSSHSSDHHYLKKDLIKTLILASLALGIQLAIFFSLNKGLIHF